MKFFEDPPFPAVLNKDFELNLSMKEDSLEPVLYLIFLSSTPSGDARDTTHLETDTLRGPAPFLSSFLAYSYCCLSFFFIAKASLSFKVIVFLMCRD